MERAEKIGLGIASAAHVLLFALLSTSWSAADPLNLRPQPIEVTIADEVAMQSTAPTVSDEPPPPASGEIEGPPEPPPPSPAETLAAPEPPAPAPKPVVKPQPKPKPAPKPAAEAKPKPSPEKKDATRSRGSLKLNTSDWMRSDSPSEAKAKSGVPAASVGPAQQSALAAEIRRQVKPYWKAPTGADAELLRTTLLVKLARDGSLVGEPEIVNTAGVTDSNRTQVRLHQEQAIKAVRLAAPFRLPPDLYEGWKSFTVNVDRKLSQ